MKILVADRISQMGVDYFKSQKGFEVVEAPDGVSALEHLKSHGKSDLALVDLDMPGIDGVEFLVKRPHKHVSICTNRRATVYGITRLICP